MERQREVILVSFVLVRLWVWYDERQYGPSYPFPSFPPLLRSSPSQVAVDLTNESATF